MRLLRRVPLLLLALSLAAGLPAEPDPIASREPLLLPASPATRPDSPDPAIRAVAIRQLIYAEEIPSALQLLTQEKNPQVLAEALAAIGDRRAQEKARDFILPLRFSPDPQLAALAYTVLGPSPLGTPAILQEGFQHPNPQVRRAALAAAADSPEAAELQAALRAQSQTADAPTRDAATAALFKLTLSNAPEEIPPLTRQLLAANPPQAASLLAALLQLGIQPDASLTAALLALPPEQLPSLVAVYRNFPGQLDSDFLRAVATRTDAAAASEAVRLLSRKSSPKTTATVRTLSSVLESGNQPVLAAFLDSFDADLEFSSFSQTASASAEPDDNKDRFNSFEMATSSIASGSTANQPPAIRNPQTSFAAKPESAAALQFLNQFDALSRNAQLTGFQRARAALLLQQTIRGSGYADLLHKLLDPANPDTVRQAAARSAFRCWETPRFAEIALLAAQSTANPRQILADISWLAPFLVSQNSPETTQVFAATGRLLLQQQNVEKQLLGLILLSHHGTPSAATSLLPFCQSTNPALRRAAWQALSSAAPEVFFLRAEEILSDREPDIRGIFPLALLKSGYRWEHRLDAVASLPQWITPRFTMLSHPFELREILARLSRDTDATVRKNARLAAIQHEEQDPQTGIALLPASGDPLLAAQLRTSFPSLLIDAASAPTASRQQHAITLAVFLQAESPAFADSESAVYMFRQLHPRQPVRLFYSGSENARRALQALCTSIPISLADRQAPVLLVSSGAWWSGEKADLARLEELAQNGMDARNPDLLDQILPAASPIEDAAFSAPLALPQFFLLGGLALSGVIGVLGGAWWWRKKSRRRQRA